MTTDINSFLSIRSSICCVRVYVKVNVLFTRRGTLRRKPRKNYTVTKRNINSMLILFLFLFLFIFFFSLFLVANALTRITRHCFLILASIYIFYIYIYIYIYVCTNIYTRRVVTRYIYIHLILLFGFRECHVNAGLGHVLQCNKLYGIFLSFHNGFRRIFTVTKSCILRIRSKCEQNFFF